MLQHAPGIQVRYEGIRGTTICTTRPEPSFTRGLCPLRLYVDGIPLQGFDLNMISPESVQGMEVFHGVSAPLEWQMENPCGVILVWLRH